MRARQELETLLDDDQDMAEMYLTRRAAEAERGARWAEERRQSDAEMGVHGASADPKQNCQSLTLHMHHAQASRHGIYKSQAREVVKMAS